MMIRLSSVHSLLMPNEAVVISMIGFEAESIDRI